MTVKLCALGGNILLLYKLLQMAAKFRARVRSHAAANSHGQVIAARKGPDVTLKVWKKFYGDGVGSLRNEIPLRHFQFVALQGPRLRHQLVAGACGEHQKIGFVPFAFKAVTRFRPGGIHAHDVRALHAATRLACPIQQHAVQHRPRINHDRMRHVERGAMLFAADQVHRMYKFFRVGIFKQEREALDGFVRQPAAARLFPGQVLIKNGDFVSRASELFTAHCAGGSAADDCYLRHG